VAIFVAALAITTLAAGAPHVFRRMDGFVVRHVEVRGTRLLDPAAALAASRIPEHATVFDDFEPWRAALLEHPLVADAAVARRLPDTIVLEIRETLPVALARTPELRPVDRQGRVLPVAPGVSLDLPVLGGPAPLDDTGRITGDAHHALLATLAIMQELQPAVAAWISEAQTVGRDGVRLLLRWPAGAQILLPHLPEPERLEQLALVLSDLAATPPAAGADATTRTELARLRRIDVRFRDQVIVSLTGGTPRRTPSRQDR
jgi:hypothetical protein